MARDAMLTLVGVSHHRAPIELRERVALDLEGSRAVAERLGREAVVVSTCNRTELYLAGDPGAEERAIEILSALAGDSSEALQSALYRLREEAVGIHLFRVAAGLDSRVPGEGEILGQLRAAHAAGTAGPILDRLFCEALRAGRRVRAETTIGRNPASVPSAAAAHAQQLFGDLAARRVLLLGAGKMSASTAHNLVSRGAEIAVVANRTLEHGERLALQFGARAIPLADVVDELAHVDIVVSSTSAPGFVISQADVAAIVPARMGRSLLLVDLAVPRDIDPAVRDLDGCFLSNVDDLEAVVAETITVRRSEAARAERLLEAEVDRFREWRASRDVMPTIVGLRALAEEIRDGELERVSGQLSDGERQRLESVTSKILAKLLHLPTIRMKEAALAADGVAMADVVQHLFGLARSNGLDDSVQGAGAD
jgi:glutamyl-tRNA reductase